MFESLPLTSPISLYADPFSFSRKKNICTMVENCNYIKALQLASLLGSTHMGGALAFRTI